MALGLKPGTRLRSVTCTTQVVVVQGAGEADLCCGGVPMVDVASDDPMVEPAPAFMNSTELGKRYVDVDEAVIEVLCTKAGIGSLSLGDTLLVVKGAKPLPSSD